MSELRFVFDTNVVVSAVLLKKSVSRRVFDTAQLHGDILISQGILNELDEVFRREKLNKYVTEGERLQFLSALVQKAIVVDVTIEIRECRDPKNDQFLELAVSGNADYLVSGDKDLLVLHPFRDIPIVRPDEMMDILLQ